MNHFHYKALKLDGASIEATVEGESRSDVLARLKRQGLVVVKLDSIQAKARVTTRIPRGLITRFYVLLGNQLQVGVPLLSALELIVQQEKSASGKHLLADIAKQVESGQTLSTALEKHAQAFSIIDLNLLRAGEEGGFLPEAIERIAYIRQWQKTLVSGALGAAAYPLLLVCISLVLLPSMLVYLVPKLEPIFSSLRRDAKLPIMTSLLLDVSRLLEQYGTHALAGSVIVILAIYAIVPKSRLRTTADYLVLRVPLIGDLIRDFILARFFRILGTLLQNKIQILASLKIAIKVLGNADMSHSFRQLCESVSTGKRLAASLDATGRIPTDVLAMIGVAEQSNTLDTVLIKVAEQLEQRTNQRLEVVMKLIEPLLLLFMAVFVGIVVLALLLPIFEGQTLG